MTEESTESDGLKAHYEGGLPILPGPMEREDAERTKEKAVERKYKEEQASIQRGILRTQIALVLFGLIGVGFTCWQVYIAQKSVDISDRSVLLAQKSERDARLINEKQLAQNQAQFDSTLLEMRKQTRADSAAASGTVLGAQTAKDTLIASDRPWIIADVHADGSLQFTKTGLLSLPITYSLKNTGHSPAVNASTSVEIFVPPFNVEKAPYIERDKLCEQANERSDHLRQAIFPSGIAPDVTTEMMTAVRLRQGIQEFISPTIILCVAYQTTLESSWHHTGMILSVEKVEGGQTFGIQVGQAVPADKLRVSPSLLHGVLAD